MNYLFRKSCVLFISTFCLLHYSCKSNDEADPLVADLILNEIQMVRGNEIIMMEFSEDGRPVSQTDRTFIYDANNQLIESVEDTGWFVLPTNYTYLNNLLVTREDPKIGFSDVVSQQHTEFSYNGTSVTQTGFYNGEVDWRQIYTFISSDYKHLIRKEVIGGPNTQGINSLFEYDYDADFNLISVHRSEEDSNTGDLVLKYTYTFEYDAMKNPFIGFLNHNPLVFGLLEFPFDTETLVLRTATDPLLRRNGNHNLTKVSQFNVNSGSTYNWIYEYVYNADGYPTEKKRFYENGDLLYELTFSYY